jgi:heat shock protein HtpX
MFWNQIKTVLFLGLLSGLLLATGHLLGGSSGLQIALVFALIMNFITYFFADRLVLALYGAEPLDQTRYAWLYDIVRELCTRAKLPMPKLWLIRSDMANAFATGRNPKNASIAVTEGILELLNESELRGVLSHELSHVKNRDILIATIAATIAMAIGYVANMARWSLIFGRGNREEGGNGLGAIVTIILIPIAATLIQLAISRSREFLADETGAKISQSPLALASALEKISTSPKVHATSQAVMATENMFIMNPFSAESFWKLLSTHPSTKDRIKRLHAMAASMGR